MMNDVFRGSGAVFKTNYLRFMKLMNYDSARISRIGHKFMCRR